MGEMTEVYGEDWVGLYDENGKLIYQGHSLRSDRILEYLGYSVKHIDGSAYMYDHGSLPERLEDYVATAESDHG